MNKRNLRDRGSGAIRGWWVILPTALILILVLALTSTSQAAPAPQPQPLLTQLLFQEQQTPCQSCHPEEQAAWKNSVHAQAVLDPAFQEQLGKSHNQEACLACHTTGFDAGHGTFMAEGVTCEACHGAYKEGHPKSETMQLPMESATCRMCHTAAFEQWETSQHAANQIDCFDCHQAHTQGLRLGSQEKLCAACHSDEQTNLAHSKHGISGVDCMSCHMSSQMKETSDTGGIELAMSNHSFTVASDVCIRCHADSSHPETAANQLNTSTQAEEAAPASELQSRRLAELEQQVTAAEKQAGDLRNLAVLGMGLTLGIGGALGMVVGVGGATLLRRRKTQ